MQWAKSVGIFNNYDELEPLARSVDDCGDVYFVPAFNGIFSPYWRDDARGLLIGMGINTTKGHLARALIEAPCLRAREVIDAMVQDSNKKIERVSVDGGLTVNNFLLQTQADFTNIDVVRKREKEITGIGAAIAAGLNAGVWESLEELESIIKVDKVFSGTLTEEQRTKKFTRFEQAVERSIGFGWAD